jgi:hypothetical protein
MAILTFDVELIYEGTGHFLNFDYDFEEFDLTEEEAKELADSIESGLDQGFYDEIMNNISIVPRLLSISGVDDESD